MRLFPKDSESLVVVGWNFNCDRAVSVKRPAMNRACLHHPSWRPNCHPGSRIVRNQQSFHALADAPFSTGRVNRARAGRSPRSTHLHVRARLSIQRDGTSRQQQVLHHGALLFRHARRRPIPSRRTRDGTGWRLAAARIVAFATLADYIQGRVPETDSPRRVAVEVTDGNHAPLMAAVLTVGFVPVARLKRRDEAMAYRAKPSQIST
jgi:hypothetical protein